jgi:hypothetical protein
MPTVKNISGPYRFFFFSFDCNEPIHIHVQHDRNICKFWLEPVSLCSSHGFSPHELNKITKLIREKMGIILEAWNEHCE